MEYILLQSLDFAHAFVRHQSAECLEAACVIVGVKDATEMAAAFIVNIIVTPFHSCILDCAIHLFDLPVCPWMVRVVSQYSIPFVAQIISNRVCI